jgi:hypothetical protein
MAPVLLPVCGTVIAGSPVSRSVVPFGAERMIGTFSLDVDAPVR